MATKTADFEAGTNGNTIATGDAGSQSAWNAAAGAPKYDTTHAAHGSKAAKVAANNDDLFWSGIGTTYYGRGYFWFQTGGLGTTGITFIHCIRQSGSPKASILIDNATKKLVLKDAGANQVTSTNAVTLDQFVRIEWFVVASATVGQIEVKIFNSPESATPTETLTSPASWNTGTANDFVGLGYLSTNSTTASWIDNLVVGGASYPGPFPVNSVAPAVTGLAPVGSTLSCSTGTWNGTFTYTYQWTRDGSNIGGATSSTYVTQAADVGHAVGCKVTATGVQATNESALQASSNTVTVTSTSTLIAPGYRFAFS